MPETKKINLGALQQNFITDKNKASSEIPEENSTPIEKTNEPVTKKVEPAVEKNIPVIEKKEPIQEKIEQVEKKKIPKIVLPPKQTAGTSTPEKKLQKQSEHTKNQELKTTQPTEKQKKADQEAKNKDVFQNYQSIFTRERETILQKIKKVKIIKTRPQLVFGLIGCTLTVLTSLFIFDPSRHSLTVYKASLLQSYDSLRGIEVETVEPIKLEPTQNIPKEETIQIGNRTFTIYSQDNNGKQIFGYDGKDFTSQKALEKYIKLDILKQTKEKIIEHVGEK